MITRKWAKGNMITTFDQFNEQEYIWVNGKVYHCGWFQSWQYRQVSVWIKSGRVYEVVRAKYPAGIVEKDGEFTCSICAEPVLSESKYCPHCGTRLKWIQTNLHGAADIQEVPKSSFNDRLDSHTYIDYEDFVSMIDEWEKHFDTNDPAGKNIKRVLHSIKNIAFSCVRYF